MRNKLREVIVARVEAGETKASIARTMGVHISTVKKALKIYKEHGTTNYRTRGGNTVSKERRSLANYVKEKIDTDPNISINKLARDFNVSRMTMWRVVRKDLGLKSLARVRCQQLTTKQRQGRLEKGKLILNKLRGEVSGKTIVFSDEKDFHVDKYSNRRNDRTIAKSAKAVKPKDRFVGRSKFPAKAMMFGYVGSDGKAFPPIWIKGTLNSAGYKHILASKVIPKLNSTYGMGNFIWMQDGASCHTANSVLKYLESKLGSKRFWSKGVWPANSCNLNPLDYSIWDHVEGEACKNPHNSIDSLKMAVEEAWNDMSRSYVRKVCAAFRSRVEAMVEAKGGVFEKE